MGGGSIPGKEKVWVTISWIVSFHSLFSDIDSLELYAGIHRQVFGMHRLLAKRFPYAVYYRVDGDTCIVFRVLDCRQQPEKISAALR